MENNFFDSKRTAWVSVIFVLIFTMTGFVAVGPLVGFFLSLPFSGMDISAFREKLLFPEKDTKIFFLFIQGCATFVGLIFFPFLYLKIFERQGIFVFRKKIHSVFSLLLVAFVVILFIAPNSFFIEWNSTLSLPDFLQDFESWARDKEQKAKEMTIFLTTFSSFNEFLMALLVIAVLPSIGEELVFRGILQPELQRATGHAHLAIFISAALFSAIHIQFFGFFPRLFLGVLFGYLYYWSGNVVMPMFAHFVNNGFAVTMVYLHHIGWVSFNVESEESLPWLFALSCSMIIFVCLRHFRNTEIRHSPFLQN